MEKINTIKEMYKEDLPYEKCEKFGAENLTDTELLAILIRTGTKGENSLELSRKLLYKNGFHNGLAGIHKWSLDELIQIKGIGKVKAIQLVCLSELSKRLARTSTVGKLDFSSPRTIADYYMEDMRHTRIPMRRRKITFWPRTSSGSSPARWPASPTRSPR